MAQARVFLTGATGYSGQPVLAELNRRGVPVTALVRREVDLSGCETVVGDLAAVGAFAPRIRDSSAVIHLASPRGESRDSVARYDVIATRAMIDAWQHGAFVYSSATTIYGIPEKTPLNEDHGCAPMIWYDVGKVAVENDLRSARTDGQRGPAITLRPCLIFASNDRRSDRQYFSWVYMLCRAQMKFVFDSEEGLETYGASFIGEEDYGRAVVDSLGITQPGAYHVASGFCTWRALIEAFDRELGGQSQFIFRRGGRAKGKDEVRLGQSRTELDTTAFAQATGFKPRQTMEELVHQFVAEERRQPLC